MTAQTETRCTKRKLGRTKFLATAALAALMLLSAPFVLTQTQVERRVITKVMPAYPDLARRMHVQGSVKVAVTVRADGVVKSTRVVGGNPVLIQPALEAIGKWKFEVLPNETTEIVLLTFQP